MDDLIGYGVLIAGTWGLSVYALKKIRDSDFADKPLKESAAVAIIAISFLGAFAAAFLLGANSLGTKGGGFLGIFLFLAPIFTMMFTYWRKLGEAPEGEESPAETKRKKERKQLRTVGIVLFAFALVFLAILPSFGVFGSFDKFPSPAPSSEVTAPA